MCEDITAEEDVLSGVLLRLCSNAVLCFLRRLEIASAKDIAGMHMDSEFVFPAGTEMPPAWKPGFHLLAAFCETALTAIIEYNYFDLDYRSEQALMQETSFAPMPAGVNRLHFFSIAPEAGQQGSDKPIRLLDVVSAAARHAAPGKHSFEVPELLSPPAYHETTVAAPIVKSELTDVRGVPLPRDEMSRATNPPDAQSIPAPQPDATVDVLLETDDDGYETPAYLGYTILRPRLTHVFGRSIVTPNASMRNDSNQIQVTADVVRNQVRTAVTEPINLFGVYLVAVGVPFMEQDGNLLRCAHVSAWICHYTAVLRSAVARRPTGHFPQAGGWQEATGRHYPSGGVSTSEVIAILSHSDMPPEAITRHALMQPRVTGWADRAEMARGMKQLGEAVNALPPGKSDTRTELENEAAKVWTAENVSASVCRYLNSGVPVVAVRRKTRHTQVIVGYFRRRDLADSEYIKRKVETGGGLDAVGTRGTASAVASSSSDLHPVGKPESAGAVVLPSAGEISVGESETPEVLDPGTEVTHFIISDDTDGPYWLLPISQLVDEILLGSTDFLVPLPRSLWMPGDFAERLGTRLLSQYAQQRKLRAESWAKSQKLDHEPIQSVIDTFTERLSRREFTVRTYATSGVDLKESMQGRMSHDLELVRQFSMIQLPKYVWVIEAIHRDDRHNNVRENVHAMVVLDASDTTTEDLNSDRPIRRSPPLFVHLPGQMLVPPYAITNESSAPQPDTDAIDHYWHPAKSAPYATGRWNYEMLISQSQHRTGNLSRGAAVGAPTGLSN